MNVLRKISYAVDDFCVRHNKRITQMMWTAAALACGFGVFCSAVIAILLCCNFREQMAGEEGNWFAYFFYIGWIIASAIATVFTLCWCIKCLLKARDCKYAF